MASQKTELQPIVAILLPLLFGILMSVPACEAQTVGPLRPPPEGLAAQNDPDRKYDDFRDTTTFETRPMALGTATLGQGQDPSVLIGPTEIRAIVSCKGKVDRCQEKTVSFLIVAKTRNWSLGDLHEAIFAAGDIRIGPIKYEWDGQVLSRHSLVEYVSFSMSAEDFRKLIEAKKVKVQLSVYAMDFPEEVLRELRGMESHLVPSQDRKKKEKGAQCLDFLGAVVVGCVVLLVLWVSLH